MVKVGRIRFRVGMVRLRVRISRSRASRVMVGMVRLSV